MKTKESYKSPQTEVLPVAVEVNIMSYPGGVPDYNENTTPVVWN